MKPIRKLLRKYVVVMLLVAMVYPSITVDAKQPVKETSTQKVIVIDPGCQMNANNRKEPIGPGAFKTTARATTGVDGAETGIHEYELNLQIALKTSSLLSKQGYTVLLTRNENDVNLSSGDRAMIANTANADAFIVIQTGENNGVSVVCQSEDNPYNYGNYNDARLLSDAILGSVVQEAECDNSGVTEDDDKPIINWCASPTAIVEVGDLTNADEETKLVDDEYQLKLAQGITNGIDSYFTQK